MANRDPEEDVEGEFSHLMVWYGDIRNRQERGQHFEPISLQAISIYEDKFLAKLGIEMDAFDWEMLFRLDALWMAAVPEPGSTRGAPKGETQH